MPMCDYECLNCGKESLVVVGVPQAQITGERAQLHPLLRMLLPRILRVRLPKADNAKAIEVKVS